MSIQEAFNILDLEIHSNTEEIKSKYRTLSKKYHPDQNENTSSKMSNLNEAKDIAIEFSKNKSLITVVNELARVENRELIRSQEIEREISAISNRAKKRISNRLKSMKDFTGLLGLFSGVATLITSKVVPIIDFPENSLYPKMALIVTVALGIYYLLFNTKIKKLEEQVSSFKESLDDKEYFFDLFLEIVKDKRGEKISKPEFHHLISIWNDSEGNRSHEIQMSSLPIFGTYESPKKISRLIGHKDFGKLILLKAEQHNFVDKSENISNDRFSIDYLIL